MKKITSVDKDKLEAIAIGGAVLGSGGGGGLNCCCLFFFSSSVSGLPPNANSSAMFIH